MTMRKQMWWETDSGTTKVDVPDQPHNKIDIDPLDVLPGTTIDNATVVASVIYRGRDDEFPYDLVTVLRLHAESPYFSVGVYNLTLGCWDGSVYWKFKNIVPAVACYQDTGGDY